MVEKLFRILELILIFISESVFSEGLYPSPSCLSRTAPHVKYSLSSQQVDMYLFFTELLKTKCLMNEM